MTVESRTLSPPPDLQAERRTESRAPTIRICTTEPDAFVTDFNAFIEGVETAIYGVAASDPTSRDT